MASKPSHSNQTNDAWVVVAEYRLDYLADMALGLLSDSGIPGVRFPMVRSALAEFPEAIRVLVPPDRAQEARQLIEGGDLETEAPQPEATED